MSFVHLLSESKNKKAIFKEIDKLFRIVADLFIPLHPLPNQNDCRHAKNCLYPFLRCISHMLQYPGTEQGHQIHFALLQGWIPVELGEHDT